MIYRGIKMDLTEEFPKGKTFIWWAFSSSTSSIEVLERFLGKTEYRTIFNIESDFAKNISKHSFYQYENEMLLYPARQFEVISSFNPGNQLKIIHLKEIQPPFPLIHIPQPSSSCTDISQIPYTNNYQNKELQQIIEQYTHQSEMNLEKQELNDEDIEIVVKEAMINKQCTILNLSYNKITRLGTSIIAKALNKNTTLKILSLNGNCLFDPGIQPLLNTLLLNNSKLSMLDLQNTCLTDVGVAYIAEMLKANTTLIYLLLSYNEISDQGVELLTKALTHHNITLKSLSLHYSRLVSDSSVDSLVEMLKHNQILKFISIYSCNLSEKGKEELRQIAQIRKGFNLEM
jgi:Ran GTPase-activating protein (RanGAP) involved in mRNA processing and transport